MQIKTSVLKESQTEKASSLIGSLDVIALDMANSSSANETEMENIGGYRLNFDLPYLSSGTKTVISLSNPRRDGLVPKHCCQYSHRGGYSSGRLLSYYSNRGRQSDKSRRTGCAMMTYLHVEPP